MEIKLFSKSMEEERDEIWVNHSSAGLNQSRWGSLFHGERGRGQSTFPLSSSTLCSGLPNSPRLSLGTQPHSPWAPCPAYSSSWKINRAT